MRRVCFVTAVGSVEPLEWGWDLKRIAVPMVIYCNPEVEAVLREAAISPHVRLDGVDDVPLTPADEDKIEWLIRAARIGHGDAEAYYWLDVDFIYAYLSFEFLYSELLARGVEGLCSAATYVAIPGREPSRFFGGPRRILEPLSRPEEGAGEALFDVGALEERPRAVFKPVCADYASFDPNLHFAASIEKPILHAIGDSHVLKCFAINAAIGCRSHVLVRTEDVSPISVPYAYHFTHHLGGRTMHHCGGRGTLLADAAFCGVKGGDAVVWVFGEIDVRSHVFRQRDERNRDVSEVVETLARNFVRSILEVHAAHPRLRSVVFAPIPPLDNPNYESVDLPVHGTIEERIAATRALKAQLRHSCDRHDLSFLDVADLFETERGDLCWELSDRFCHISPSYQESILQRLYRMLA